MIELMEPHIVSMIMLTSTPTQHGAANINLSLELKQQNEQMLKG